MGRDRPIFPSDAFSWAERKRHREHRMDAVELEWRLLEEGWRLEWSRNGRRWVALLKNKGADAEHGVVVGEATTKATALRNADRARAQSVEARRMAAGYPRSGRYVELVDMTARTLHVAERLGLVVDPLVRNGLAEVLVAARFGHTLHKRVHGADATDASGNRFEYKIITPSKPLNRSPRRSFHYPNAVPEKFAGAIIVCRADFAISLEQIWYWPPERVTARSSIYLTELPGLGAEDARTWDAEGLRQRVAEVMSRAPSTLQRGRHGAGSEGSA